MNKKIDVLNHGYVSLDSWMPWNMVDLQNAILLGDIDKAKSLLHKDDLGAVNAGKASFAKRSDDLEGREERLIDYLARNHENSPFRHNVIRFEIYAPLLVARQWFKYRVGSRHSEDSAEILNVYMGQGDQEGFDDPLHAWNETSRRYVTLDPEFYNPEIWRLAPDNRKQGSGDNLEDNELAEYIQQKLIDYQKEGLDLYNFCNESGLAPELSRLFLPAYGLFISWQWTASIVSVCHFLQQRLADNAQKEIQEYAQAIFTLAKQVYPISMEKIMEYST